MNCNIEAADINSLETVQLMKQVESSGFKVYNIFKVHRKVEHDQFAASIWIYNDSKILKW